MLLRPIDAIFVHPERRLYVVYYRGELWQLPRMKIDMAAWQRRQPYTGSKEALYLSQKQIIHDPLLAQKLRTLDLPIAIRGSTLPRFESWWEVNGYEWLKERLDSNNSPLAAHIENPAPSPTISKNNTNDEKLIPTMPAVTQDIKVEHQPIPVADDIQDINPTDSDSNRDINSSDISLNDISPNTETDIQTDTDTEIKAQAVDVFADMLAELADEVASHRQQ